MSKIKQFLTNYRAAIFAWLLIVLVIEAGLYYRVDKSLVALAVVVVGVLGHAFAALVVWIGFVPIVGPMIAHLLSPLPPAFERGRVSGVHRRHPTRLFKGRPELQSRHHHTHLWNHHWLRAGQTRLDHELQGKLS